MIVVNICFRQEKSEKEREGENYRYNGSYWVLTRRAVAH